MSDFTPYAESPTDTSRAVLDWVHRLLSRPDSEQPDLRSLLGELAEVFGGQAAGLASLPGVENLVYYPDASPDAINALPWHTDPDLIERASSQPVGIVTPHRGGALLLTVFTAADQSSWLIWVEDLARSWFSESEQAALALVGCSLGRRLGQINRPAWAESLDHQMRQRQLEAAALITRRLAHDFGNVLTGILGFTELALGQQFPPNSLLHSYLDEVHRAAQHGAQFTQQLRLFSRRQSSSSRSSHLAHIFAEQEARQFAAQPTGLHLRLHIPADLPPVALDPEHLNQVVAALLDNAREALTVGGSISVSARTVELDARESNKLFGSTAPGPHVEIIIADTGSGLTPEAQRRVLTEPFFSTKPRRKGFGLSVSYGILSAHKGGIRLHAGEERGVVVRVLLPVAVVPASSLGLSDQAGTANHSPVTRNERLLIVDDEPEILRFVSVTLQGAGYRVQGVGSGDAALKAYFAQPNDPFALILSDVIMPGVGGVELAHRLLRRDPQARVLFMSGHVTPDFMQADLTKHAFELLPKPFRAEQLLKTVRTVLDRESRRSLAHK